MRVRYITKAYPLSYYKIYDNISIWAFLVLCEPLMRRSRQLRHPYQAPGHQTDCMERWQPQHPCF
jgi:hypothetical protein